MITSGKARPSTTCVAIVNNLAPPGHVRSAAIQVRAPSTLTKVEDLLPEEAVAISWAMLSTTSAICTHNSPSVPSISTMIPEEHASMATMLKHLKSHQMPPSTDVPPCLAIAPAMQAIVVDCVSIVDPQLAPIIGDNAEMVMASPEDSQAPCPTHGKVIATRETRPSATCVPIVHHSSPAGHVWSAAE
jgi:hypothetical protein